MFYGGNIMKPWGEGPTPFDLTPYVHCPIVGFFGNEDPNPSPADVDRLSAQLDKYRKAHEFHRYDGAGHAFLNFTNTVTYREGPARDAWEKLIPFLQRHLQSSRQPRQRLPSSAVRLAAAVDAFRAGRGSRGGAEHLAKELAPAAVHSAVHRRAGAAPLELVRDHHRRRAKVHGGSPLLTKQIEETIAPRATR